MAICITLVLDRCHLRLSLGTTCTSLQQASLEWFPDVTAHSQPWEDTMPAIEAWLKRYQTCLYVTAIDADSSKGLQPRVASITALPATLVTWLTVYTYSVLPAEVSTLTALDWLNLRGPCTDVHQQISAQLLQPLIKLRVLCMRRTDLACGQQLLSLPALRGLQAWEMDCGVLQRLTPGTLAQLTGLTLFRSRIISTAPLAALQRVGHMSLCSCSLRAVPEELSALTALAWLDLSDNRQLVGGWQHLAPLIRLRRLELFGCRLGAERQQALGLPALTYLGLSYNGLVALPQQLSALTALVSLDLAGNSELDGGWQPLQSLTQLRDLELFQCSLTAVPEQLSALTALTCLNLSGHSRLAGGWQHMLLLQDLNLSNCNITAFPEQLSVLTALTSLQLTGNISIYGGWQHLARLPQLCTLHLEACDFTAMPRLLAMPALTRLNLSGNTQLDGGWQHLAPLISLQCLDLSNCGLTAMPQQVSALKALTSLNLSYNRLTSGWQHLLPLTQLQYLDVDRNSVPSNQMPGLPNLHIRRY